MGSVFVHTMMSLDGFIAGPNDDDVSTLRASLQTLDVSASGQIVNLRLRVDKAPSIKLTTRSPNEEVA